MTQPKIPASVTGYFQAIRDSDPAAWAQNMTIDAEGHDPVGAPVLRGRAAFETMLTGFLGAWQDFYGLTETEAFASGNAIAVRWDGKGHNSRGTKIEFSGVTMFFLDDDGLIERFYSVFDSETVARQLKG
jgi:steroid delta-isomerase